MIEYELAKKLKDAGFTMKIRGFHPTLSELIEACGDEFMMLSSPKYKLGPLGKWKADNGSTVGVGDSPEEAVAYLWLVLHERKHPTGSS